MIWHQVLIVHSVKYIISYMVLLMVNLLLYQSIKFHNPKNKVLIGSELKILEKVSIKYKLVSKTPQIK